MSHTCHINIILDDKTQKRLIENNYYLRIFKGFKTHRDSACSILWLSTNDFSNNVKISWKECYYAYIDKYQDLKRGIVIDTDYSKPINIGDRMIVGEKGITEVDQEGYENEITIHNMLTKEYVCGIGQIIQEKFSPLCALPLVGMDYCSITPTGNTLLVFDLGEVKEGTVVEHAWAKSIIIDLSREQNQKEAILTYDIDEGWNGNDISELKIYQDTISIARNLIEVVPRL